MAAALAPRGCALRVFDPALADQARGSGLARQVEALGVDVAASLDEALRGARLVVLDDSPAREQPVPALQHGQTLLDLRRTTHSGAGPARHLSGCFQPDDADAGGARLWISGTGAGQLATALNAMGLAATATTSLPAAHHPAPAAAATAAAAGANPPVVLRGELP